MTFSRHLRIALFYGCLIGAVVGHIDITYRVISMFFEWFEIYLGLLVPILSFSILAALMAAVLHLACQTVGRIMTPRTAHIFYLLLGGFALAVSGGVALINLVLFPDGSMWEGKKLEMILLLIFVLSASFTFAFKRRKFWFPKAVLVARKFRIQALVTNYLTFILIFCAICLPLDYYQIKSIPALPSNPNKSSAGPNIVLITLDTVRADYLTPYGSKEDTTPNLAALAKDSVLFENAISPSSWTLPSHASIFTGKWIYKHGATQWFQELSPEHARMASLLRKQGYRTAAFVGGGYCKARHGFGIGFDTYKDRLDFFEYRNTFDRYSMRRLLDFFTPSIRMNILGSDGEQTAPQLNEQIFRWIDKNGSDPFFLFINYFDAHEPYKLGDEFLERYTREKRDYTEIHPILEDYYYNSDLRYKRKSVDPDLRDYIAALYKSELTFLDRELQQLIDKLKATGKFDNTIFIVTADHGEEFMEHGGFTHKQTLYREVTHVPLLIHYPKQFPPKRVKQLVSSMDLFSTVNDLAKVQYAEAVDAVSLLPFLTGSAVDSAQIKLGRPYVLGELYAPLQFGRIEQHSLTEQEWSLIIPSPPQDRVPNSLFHNSNDPLQQQNLYESAEGQRDAMRSTLDATKGALKFNPWLNQ